MLGESGILQSGVSQISERANTRAEMSGFNKGQSQFESLSPLRTATDLELMLFIVEVEVEETRRRVRSHTCALADSTLVSRTWYLLHSC